MSRPFIKIVEVGPRDGLQNEQQVLSLAQKKELIERLLAAGVQSLEAASFVRSEKIPQMADAGALMTCLSTYRHKHELSALVPNVTGAEQALDAGVEHIAFFTATSDEFNRQNINATVDESLTRLRDIMQMVKNRGAQVKFRGYISTVFACPYSGSMLNERGFTQLKRLIVELQNLGCQEISFGDTLGTALPGEVLQILNIIKGQMPLSQVAMHFHDTRGMAIGNIMTSLGEGVRIFDSSIAGLGGCPYAPGASGNVATEDVVAMLESLGYATGIDQEKLKEAGAFILQALQKNESASKFVNYQLRQK